MTTAVDRRPASAGDAVDGVWPAEVLSPATLDELAACCAEVSSAGRAMVFAGNRTKIDWGLPPERLDAVVSLRELPRLVEHEAADLVVRVGASVELAELQALLARNGQRLALDCLVPGTTIGGLIATGICGPLRFGFGAVRDLVIGVAVVRSDGALAHSGGRVVKNVAGFDLAKLFTGSFGTLGCVAEAFFRLHALPESARYVHVELTYEEAADALARVVHTQAAPSAVECHATSDDAHLCIGVLVEGMARSVPGRAAAVAALLGQRATVGTDPPPWWATLPGELTVKVTAEIARVPALVADLVAAGRSCGIPVTVTGSAGVGALFLGADPAPATDRSTASLATLVGRCREGAGRAGGSAVVLRAPGGLKAALDLFGPVPAIGLMRRVKQEFDPRRALAPGRFAGGI